VIIRFSWLFLQDIDERTEHNQLDMLILLPILVYFTVYLIIFIGLSKKESVGYAYRASIVYTMGAASLFTIIFFKELGVFSVVTRLALVIVWASTLLVLVMVAWRKGIFVDAICGYDSDQSGLIFAYKDKAMTLYLSPEYYMDYKNR